MKIKDDLQEFLNEAMRDPAFTGAYEEAQRRSAEATKNQTDECGEPSLIATGFAVALGLIGLFIYWYKSVEGVR